MRLFDEINDLSQSNILSIDDYFDEMEGLTEKEREQRKKFAFEMEETLLFIFVLFSVMKQYGSLNKQYIIGQLQTRYLEAVSRYVDVDHYIENYIKEFAVDTVSTTLKNEDTPYFTSGDRAVLIAENESHFTFSRKEYFDAIKAGKTKKQWIDIRDKRERETHREIGGTVIQIDQPFIVGNSLMMFATDHSLNAEAKELINCRCTTKYF